MSPNELPFRNMDLPLEQRTNDLLQRLNLKEKLLLCAGKRFWNTSNIRRLGIPSFKMTDGPHGVGALGAFFRKATYFPTAIGRTATWNLELSYQFGQAIAEEVRHIGFHMLLAPGMNIIRTPMCGRNFEYQTEDPFLNKKTAVAVVKGVQSKNIAACIKHYVTNNQDTNRMQISAEIDSRTLHEIYLPAFKACVEEADAWSVMAAYNKINGTYACENSFLLQDLLRDTWGFSGFVVTDWFAARQASDTASCINSGLNLEMPGFPKASKLGVKQLNKAINEGKVSLETIDKRVSELLGIMFRVGLFDDPKMVAQGKRNTKNHQNIAYKIAQESIVLLKNENDILPLKLDELRSIAVLGPNANKKMGLGGGSSMVRAYYEITPLKGIQERCNDKVNITNNPEDADIAIVVVGLDHSRGKDSEARDKTSFDLPEKHINLIHETVRKNPNTIVVLICGSPVATDWINKVPAVVLPWYAGMEAGRAIADILFGDINPSAKLPVTFPKKLTDSPAHQSERTFPGVDDKVHYAEEIFVGYRYFDKENIEPLFPFGFGLSYTQFEYKDLDIDTSNFEDAKQIKVTVTLTNIGNRAGMEIAQLYVRKPNSTVIMPNKELEGFKKTKLEPQESQKVVFLIEKSDLKYFDVQEKGWKFLTGMYTVMVGSSSRDIRLRKTIAIP